MKVSASWIFALVFALGLVAITVNQYNRSQPADLGVMEIVAVDCRDTGDCLPPEVVAR